MEICDMQKISSRILMIAICTGNVFATADTERQSLIINTHDQFKSHTQTNEKKGCFACFGKKKQQAPQYNIQNSIMINVVKPEVTTGLVSYTGIVNDVTKPLLKKSRPFICNVLQSPIQSVKDQILVNQEQEQNIIIDATSVKHVVSNQLQTTKPSLKRVNSAFIQLVPVSDNITTEQKLNDDLQLSVIQKVSDPITLFHTDFDNNEITQLKQEISKLQTQYKSIINQQNQQSQIQPQIESHDNQELQKEITNLYETLEIIKNEILVIKKQNETQQSTNQLVNHIDTNSVDEARVVKVENQIKEIQEKFGEKVINLTNQIESSQIDNQNKEQINKLVQGLTQFQEKLATQENRTNKAIDKANTAIQAVLQLIQYIQQMESKINNINQK